MEAIAQTEVGTAADKFFKIRMRNEGWDIRDDETVSEFILRSGHPFQISYGDEREDN